MEGGRFLYGAECVDFSIVYFSWEMDDWVRKGRVIELAVGFFHLLLFFIKKTNGELDRFPSRLNLAVGSCDAG